MKIGLSSFSSVILTVTVAEALSNGRPLSLAITVNWYTSWISKSNTDAVSSSPDEGSSVKRLSGSLFSSSKLYTIAALVPASESAADRVSMLVPVG